LGQAKKHATAMQGLAEVEGNPMKIKEAQQRLERDITPLAREVFRALQESSPGGISAGGREELFAQANAGIGRDMEALIGSSEDLLRESLS
jgi:hypothetical protein